MYQLTRQNNLSSNNQAKNPQSSNSIATRIFLIIRKQVLTKLIELELCRQNYQVEIFHDGMSAAIAIREAEPDLIILDWPISFLSGFDICYFLRSSNNYYSDYSIDRNRER